MAQATTSLPDRAARRAALRAALRRSHLVEMPDADDATDGAPVRPNAELRCRRCGIAVGVPDVSFDRDHVCSLCRRFERDRDRIARYFGTPDILRAKLSGAGERAGGRHDCVVLFSGGKDSTYMLFRLVEMGLSVLSLTFDNGFISAAAFANIDAVVRALGIEHIALRPASFRAALNESIDRHATPCKGCFKGLLDGAVGVAGERRIPFIVTGLSRGQIAEERLQWFHARNVFDPDEIDAQLARARGVYHRKDAYSGNPYWRPDIGAIAEGIGLVDYYRFDPATRDDIVAFLRARPEIWKQPADCGFCSTNCLVNDIGIGLHKARTGWHNYEIATAWDVRLGHLALEEAGEDLKEVVDADRSAVVLRALGRTDAPAGEEPVETISCRIRAHVTHAQVTSALDRVVPGWQAGFRLAYGPEVAPAPADPEAPRAWVPPASAPVSPGNDLAGNDLAGNDLGPAFDGRGPPERLALAAPAGFAAGELERALCAVLLDHGWTRGPGAGTGRAGIPDLRTVSFEAVPAARHLAALDTVLDRMTAPTPERPGRLQAVLCRRGEAMPAWIALSAPAGIATWERWRALVDDLAGRIGARPPDRGASDTGPARAPVGAAETDASGLRLLSGSLCVGFDAAWDRAGWGGADPETAYGLLSGAAEEAASPSLAADGVDLVDARNLRRMIASRLAAAIARIRPSAVARIGIRLVGPGESRLPQVCGLAPILDPCGRWPTVAGAVQLVIETSGARPVVVVHADGSLAPAAQVARDVLACLTAFRPPGATS